MEKTGKAYCFIKCDKPIAQIEAIMPKIRKSALTPDKLELKVTEGINSINGDELLQDTVIRDLQEEGKCNYVFEANLQGATNKMTATELRDIFNQAYQSPLFEPKPEAFYGTIVYRNGNQYEQLE